MLLLLLRLLPGHGPDGQDCCVGVDSGYLLDLHRLLLLLLLHGLHRGGALLLLLRHLHGDCGGGLVVAPGAGRVVRPVGQVLLDLVGADSALERHYGHCRQVSGGGGGGVGHPSMVPCYSSGVPPEGLRLLKDDYDVLLGGDVVHQLHRGAVAHNVLLLLLRRRRRLQLLLLLRLLLLLLLLQVPLLLWCALGGLRHGGAGASDGDAVVAAAGRPTSRYCR